MASRLQNGIVHSGLVEDIRRQLLRQCICFHGISKYKCVRESDYFHDSRSDLQKYIIK